MNDVDKIKFEFAKKFNLSENSIDESIIPILLALDENTKANNALNSKIKGSIKTVNYNNSKVAFIGNLSIYTIPVLIVCISLIIVWWGWIYQQTHTIKYQNLERLENIIQVKNDEYFIPKEKYKVIKDGIVIIEK